MQEIGDPLAMVVQRFDLQYGVAMIGNGVSTVVSLRLPRAVEEAG